MRLALALVWIAALGVAHAEAGSHAQAQAAQSHVDTGTRLFKQGRFAEALAEFQRAEPMVTDPAALSVLRYNVARCLEQMQQPEAAVAAFERYLKMPDTPAALKAGRARLESLRRAHFGAVTLKGMPPDANCTVRRDAPEPTAATPSRCLPGENSLLAGRYAFDVQYADSAHGRTLTAEIAAGSRQTLEAAAPGWLVVDTRQSGGEVALDGAHWVAESGAGAPVEAGLHVLTLGRDGAEVWRTALHLSPGESRRIVAGGPTETPEDGTEPALGAEASAARSAGRGPWPWVLAAGAAGGLAGGVVFGLRTVDAVDAGDRAFKRVATAPDQAAYTADRAAVKRHDGDARSNRIFAYGLAGAGLIGGGIATWLLLRDDAQASHGGVTLRAAPNSVEVAF